MVFHSILFNRNTFFDEKIQNPNFYDDLKLDLVIQAITSQKQDYNLNPYFYFPLEDLELIQYRQEIFKDLENDRLREKINEFAEQMIIVHRYKKLIENLEFEYHKKGWYLDTVIIYCKAVVQLVSVLEKSNLTSNGFQKFCEYIKRYSSTSTFTTMFSNAQNVKKELSEINYCVKIHRKKISVKKYENELDYSQEILKKFEKFRSGPLKDYEMNLFPRSGMNHIEARILEIVVELFPTPFLSLSKFCEQFPDFLDNLINTFDREIQFYIAYLEFITKFNGKGLEFCYPDLTTSKQMIFSSNGFDIALATKFLETNDQIVCNDFFLTGKERILVITGPNQGGKTTFARMFGQLHYLARLGVLIPGNKATLFLSDNIFTHFEKEEQISSLHGKLNDDLTRIKSILSNSTSNSIVIMNEIFSSTSLEDAIFLSKEILQKLLYSDIYCVMVTFIDELSRLGLQTVSMVSTVLPENPTLRTFKIERKEADGLAYALSLARKHRLTYDQILERLRF